MDWLWLVLLVGFMVVMHRFGFGCCGGHGHKGADKGHEDEAKTASRDREEKSKEKQRA